MEKIIEENAGIFQQTHGAFPVLSGLPTHLVELRIIPRGFYGESWRILGKIGKIWVNAPYLKDAFSTIVAEVILLC